MNPAAKIFLLSLCLVGCKQDNEIKTYRLAKDPDAAPKTVAPFAGMGGMMSTNSELAPAATSKDIEWTVPSGWKVQPASSMRVGSFLINGADGQTADVSVIPLAGEAGGDLANVNRWRDQISLPPISAAQLPSMTEKRTINGQTVQMVDLLSDKPLIENKFKKRLIAAAVTHNDRTWFFKMIGDDATVKAAKPQFVSFISSVHFKK